MNLSNRLVLKTGHEFGGLPSQDLSHDISNLAICQKKKKKRNVVTDSLSTRSSKEKVRGGRERERDEWARDKEYLFCT